MRLELHGARTASGVGLAARGEFCWPIESSEMTPNYLRETRDGRNVQRKLVPLLRLSVYSRWPGYKDANDAEGVASNPATQGWLATRQRLAIPAQAKHRVPLETAKTPS